MRIAIRTDSSIDIGSGHVMRCMRVARGLLDHGHEITFFCRPLPGDLITFIEAQQFRVVRLMSPSLYQPTRHDADYARWLQVPVLDDARDFVLKAGSADIVLTDHYAIGEEWQRSVKASLKCAIVVIDDLIRVHDAELIVDQTIDRDGTRYAGNAKVLAGTKYALLDKAFATARETAICKPSAGTATRLLLSMGGYDKANVTLCVLKALVDKRDIKATVLLGPSAPHYAEVVKFCESNDAFEHLDFVSDMPKMMTDHHIAIGAPGATSWERACVGLPAVLIPAASNQQEIGKRFADKKAAIVIDHREIDLRLPAALDKIIANWWQFHEANISLCDGLGIFRFLLEFDQIFNAGKYDFELREASLEDIATVFIWQSDEKTRRYALNPKVPTWEEHEAWMRGKLSSRDNFFYIISEVQTSKKVGAIRLDRVSVGVYLVSIFVDPKEYGRGIAAQGLTILGKLHPNIQIKATVLEGNKASQRLFEKVGYRRVDIENFVREKVC